jgi:hypothetical protein
MIASASDDEENENAAASAALTHTVRQNENTGHNSWHVVNDVTPRGLESPTKPKLFSANFVHIPNITQ